VGVGPLAFGILMLAACDSLLDPEQPGIITPESIASAGPTGAQALYVGALGEFQGWTGGGGGSNSQNVWVYSDLLTDVWKTSDTFSQRINMDRRNVETNDGEVSSVYTNATQSRGRYREALRSLREFRADEPEKQGHMYLALGYTEMNMSEVFCNGIPFGETVNGQVIYTEPLTNEEGFELALTHLDSAITLAAGTGDLAERVRYAAQVAKGRTLVNLGRFAEAATAVADVPDDAQLILTFSQQTQTNALWTTNYSSPATARMVVGDSVSMVNGVATLIRNAIPFGSANDPRVPVAGAYNRADSTGFDGSTPYVAQLIWTERESPIVIASGIDARLIEAEAELRLDDYAGMMAILNALRASARTLGDFVVPAMAALPVPTTRDAAIDIFFREKAFWQFARGTRLGDLRRLIRQYGRTEENVFPEGGFHKTPFQFGNDVNLPVTDNEQTNPFFTGCIDRNA
jgi:hypothetical protein